MHMRRQYVEAPCTDAYTTTAPRHVAVFWDAKGGTYTSYWAAYDGGMKTFKPYEIEAGGTVNIETEINWNRPNIDKSFSVTVWGEVEAVTIKHNDGIPSDHRYVFE